MNQQHQQLTVISSNHVFISADKPNEAATLVLNGDHISQVLPRTAFAQFATQPGALDVGDQFVCPGFHDAHQHVFHAALFPSKLATEYVGTSEKDCVNHLLQFAATRPGNGWVVSHGWRETAWTPSNIPTCASLDEAFQNRPVALYSGDAHTLWINTCGMREVGITDTTKPPAGGSFERDERGHLTGVLREAAAMVYIARILSSFSMDELTEIYSSYFALLNSMGITSVCDMALSLVAGADGINPQVYEALQAEGKLSVRAHVYPTLTDDLFNLEKLQERLTGPKLRAPGFKQFFDGVSSQHTAWCSEPYTNARFVGDVGRPTVPAARMRELVLKAAKAGHSVRIHTIGDRAVSEALSIFEEAHMRFGVPSQGVNTMEHIEDIVPSDLTRFAAAGVVASVQPPHVTIELAQPARDLGEQRASRMWPFAQMVDAGATLALGTDAPVVPANSGDVLYTACTRKTPVDHQPAGGWYPKHALNRIQALSSYTQGSAAATGRAHELGTLEPGMFADFAVWDTNLLTCTDEQLQSAHPILTVCAGEKVFECATSNRAQ
ncbi:amidohydrolase [Atopobium fossor]|uniref:amidohydrolase n=1 Tax=Atopobium fossor TaxID=39487 RepID=UPI0004035461|nr:amidohydrolase [Atopobium fossor]